MFDVVTSALGSPLATNLISLILVLVTAVYVVLTYRIAQANSVMAQQVLTQQETLNRPYLNVSVEIRSQVVFGIRIQNSGRSAATDIRLKLDRPFHQWGEKSSERNLQTFLAFSGAPFSLSPGTCLRFDLAQGFVVFGPKADPGLTPKQFTISARYRGQNFTYGDDFTIDLNPFVNSHSAKGAVQEELERLRQSVDKITQHLEWFRAHNEYQVRSYTDSEYEWEQERTAQEKGTKPS